MPPTGVVSAGSLTEFSFSIGTNSPKRPGTLKNYWTNGLGITFGARLPFSFWKRHQQTWLEYNWNSFGFDSHFRPPVNVPEFEEFEVWGKHASVTTYMCGIKLYLRDISKGIGPYLLFEAGYMRRSKMQAGSNLLEWPYYERKYRGGPAFSGGLGLSISSGKRVRFGIDYNYTIGFTRPDRTSFTSIKYGITLK